MRQKHKVLLLLESTARNDVEIHIPAFFHITPANVNDVKAMPEIPYEKEAVYIFDRGYNDFDSLYKIDLIEGTFVVRARSTLQFKQITWKRRLAKNIISDSIIKFVVYKSSKEYPVPLRNFTVTADKLNCSSNGSSSTFK